MAKLLILKHGALIIDHPVLKDTVHQQKMTHLLEQNVGRPR